MKVAIVSTPRTCSSVLSRTFSKKYELEELSEIFSSVNTHEEAEQVLSDLKTKDNYVVKLTPTSFRTFPELLEITKFPWEIFDKIVLTERTNKTEQIVSWLMLNHAQANEQKSVHEIHDYIKALTNETFVFEKYEVENILKSVNFYNEVIKPFFNSSQLHIYSLQHELLQVDKLDALSNLNEVLDETFLEEHFDEAIKSSIDYTVFIQNSNLGEILTNL